jgi:hypothetical protein
MNKYFWLHDYPLRVEAIIATYHLQGKVVMWWDHIKLAKHLDEKKVSWEKFNGYFQEKYFSEHYYERKMKEFFEIKLENIKMDEYENIFLIF